ncbi:hypothetical protein [Scandinavium manionii]|uniref:hypothetical protein n=1 Tax=Scandinavium manionii TaxID=2926520 RepID=UPI0021664E8D|nr:hypothetical protein [Scandinavium manionii]MCS2146890.1 hypothetical protein [Scandinavium manionii]
MKATVRRYLRAAGSVLDIAPSTDYTKITKTQGDYQALKSDFRRIGGDFGRAIAAANASKVQTAK